MKQIQLGIFVVVFAALGACAQESSAPDIASEAGANGAATQAEASSVAVTAGDASAGKRLYIYCQACHSLEAGGMNKVGPNLYGVLDRPAAAAEGFIYSDALAQAGITWDDATLDAWIEAPSSLVPGTTMIFAGIRDAQQRADLIAYLRESTSP
jgi:cytochrome c